MRPSIPEPLKAIAKRILFPIPSRLATHFILINGAGLDAIEKSIKDNYHVGSRSEDNYSNEKYQADLNAHLTGRLESDRRQIIPWIDSARPLKNTRILEIGCGTGCSTVALAEQGARIIGIDIDEGALRVAKDRSKVYGIGAEFKVLNCSQISSAFKPDDFDLVIFFASLEHMTIVERLTALKEAWAMLPRNGLLAVVETPNRLWYFDSHTSLLPFFNWLPNELAFTYSRLSPRESFRELFRDYNTVSKERFLRWGRGVSFHEFDLAIGPAKDLHVISSLSTFQGLRYKLKKMKLERRFRTILTSIYPSIHEGFCDDHLNLIIQKQ
ncbi:MAG: class I SAM-dependent methyltransferase [Verrucomicrobiota bacterium]|jgi:S-adenosylmethionine-dependent methyltransferase